MPNPQVQSLISTIQNSGGQTTATMTAYTALGNLKDPEAIPFLIQEFVNNSRGYVQYSYGAASALVAIAHPSCIASIKSILLTDQLLSGNAARILVAVGPDAHCALLDGASSDNWIIRLRVVEAIREARATWAAPVIAALINDENWDVRLVAGKTANEIQPPAPAPEPAPTPIAAPAVESTPDPAPAPTSSEIDPSEPSKPLTGCLYGYKTDRNTLIFNGTVTINGIDTTVEIEAEFAPYFWQAPHGICHCELKSGFDFRAHSHGHFSGDHWRSDHAREYEGHYFCYTSEGIFEGIGSFDGEIVIACTCDDYADDYANDKQWRLTFS